MVRPKKRKKTSAAWLMFALSSNKSVYSLQMTGWQLWTTSRIFHGDAEISYKYAGAMPLIEFGTAILKVTRWSTSVVSYVKGTVRWQIEDDSSILQEPTHLQIWSPSHNFMPYTHRRRRRDETVELRRVGGVAWLTNKHFLTYRWMKKNNKKN